MKKLILFLVLTSSSAFAALGCPSSPGNQKFPGICKYPCNTVVDIVNLDPDKSNDLMVELQSENEQFQHDDAVALCRVIRSELGREGEGAGTESIILSIYNEISIQGS